MKNILLFLVLGLVTISCGSDSDGDDPTPSIEPSIESFTPLMGIEGDTVTIQLANYTNETVVSVSFGTNSSPWFEVTGSMVRTVVPEEVNRGENLQINMDIDGEATSSTESFQVADLMFTDLDKTLFALGDTITITGSNLNIDESKYQVGLTDGGSFRFVTIVDITPTNMRVVMEDYPGETFFYIPLKFQIRFNGEDTFVDEEVTLTRSYAISNLHNSMSNAPGSLLHVNIFPGNVVFDQSIMLGNEELIAAFSSPITDGRRYTFAVPTSANINETLKVTVGEGTTPFLLRQNGRDTIRIKEGTYDFSPKEVIGDITAEITLEVSHVYSPPDYKVFIINQATGEEKELLSLRQTIVEQNRMVLTGNAAINDRGVYSVKFSVRDDEYILTPENGSELVFKEN